MLESNRWEKYDARFPADRRMEELPVGMHNHNAHNAQVSLISPVIEIQLVSIDKKLEQLFSIDKKLDRLLRCDVAVSAAAPHAEIVIDVQAGSLHGGDEALSIHSGSTATNVTDKSVCCILPTDGSRIINEDPSQENVDFPHRATTTNTVSLSQVDTDAIVRASELLSSRRLREGSIREKIWTFLEHPHEFGWQAVWFVYVFEAVILVSVCFSLMQTVDPPPLSGPQARVLEACFYTAFVVEVLLRFFACPSKTYFLVHPYNVIDVLATVPLPIRITHCNAFTDFETDGALCSLLLGIVPIFRLLKTLRRFEKFVLLLHIFRNSLEALPVMMFTFVIMALSFSLCIYVVEPRDNIPSIPTAMWLTIVTMTTVGYGDVTPVSPAGYIMVSMLVVSSVLYMALPLGMLGNVFTQTWNERDTIVLQKKTRDRLRQWGYTPYDIPTLFQFYDIEGTGELGIQEFVQLFQGMRIGLGKKLVHALFDTFDGDGSGSVDAEEFIKILYPEAHFSIYGGRRRKSAKSGRSSYASESDPARSPQAYPSSRDGGDEIFRSTTKTTTSS